MSWTTDQMIFDSMGRARDFFLFSLLDIDSEAHLGPTPVDIGVISRGLHQVLF
jgi:hypothetical protein